VDVGSACVDIRPSPKTDVLVDNSIWLLRLTETGKRKIILLFSCCFSKALLDSQLFEIKKKNAGNVVQ